MRVQQSVGGTQSKSHIETQVYYAVYVPTGPNPKPGLLCIWTTQDLTSVAVDRQACNMAHGPHGTNSLAGFMYSRYSKEQLETLVIGCWRISELWYWTADVSPHNGLILHLRGGFGLVSSWSGLRHLEILFLVAYAADVRKHTYGMM